MFQFLDCSIETMFHTEKEVNLDMVANDCNVLVVMPESMQRHTATTTMYYYY